MEKLNQSDYECTICQCLLYDPVSLPICQHTFCMKCIKKLITSNCPICRQSFNKNKIQNVNIIVRNTISQLFQQEYIERKTNSLWEYK